MGKILSDADAARYHRDGFLFPIDAFSPEQATHAAAVARYRAQNAEEALRYEAAP